MRLLLLILVSLVVLVPAQAQQQPLWWFSKPPDLADTGYRLVPNHVIVCTLHVPAYNFWAWDDYYGSGVGIYSHGQDIRVYAFVDREPFVHIARLGVWRNGERVNVVDMPRFDMNVQVYLAYQQDGTIKIAYRYDSNTEWMIFHTEVATADSYQVKAISASNFHLYTLNPQSTPTPTSIYPEPFPTAQPFPGSKNTNNTLWMLAGLGLILIIAVVALRR